MKGFLKKIFLLILFLPLFVYGKEQFNATSAAKGLEGSLGALSTTRLKEGNESGTYSVRFNANTGSGSMDEQVIPLNQNVMLNSNSFTKTGYIFNEWNTKIDGSGKTYTDRQYVYNLSSTDDMTIDLFAIWTPITYNITYDGNNGSGSMNTQIMTYDVSQKLAFNGYTRRGHTFAGWNTKKDGSGTSYTDQQQVTNLSSNNDATIILYAQWNASTFSIRFDSNSGTGTMESQNFTYGNSQLLNKNTFVKENYTFKSWNTKQDGTGVEINDEQEGSTLSTVNNEILVLYAQWAIEKYTVSFDANSGTGTMEDQIYTFATPEKLNSNQFTKSNYTFVGWNTNANGTGVNYSDKQEISVASNLTLYAQWAVNTYTILYHSNGANGVMSNQVMPVDTAQSLTPNAFTKSGYTFSNWNTKEDGTGNRYADKEEVKNLSTINGSQVVLYAQWEVNHYKVIFDANGGTGTMEEQSFTYQESQNLSENQFTKERNRFDGWNTKADGTGNHYSNKQSVNNLTTEADGIVVLYAEWKDNTYVINFNANSGTGEMTSQTLVYGQKEKITANAFTKQGNTFVNWNTEADGTGKKYENEEEIETINSSTNTITLYAQWRLNQYTISFLPNGGTGNMENMTITHGQSQNLRKNTFRKDGYVFNGWNTKPDGTGTQYNDEQSISSLPGYTVLYAQWKGNSFTVVFNSNGGEGTMANEEFTYGSQKSLSKNTFTKTRYGFKEWNTKADGTGTSFKDEADGSTLTTDADATVNLYAIWKDAVYEVKFNSNGGTGTMNNQVIDYGKTVNLNPCMLTRTGYTFTGWNTDSNGGGTFYTDEGSIRNLTESNNEVINLYAQWKANTYTVSYNANGGEGMMSSQSFTYDVEKFLATSGFVREGYKMNGWNTSSNGSGAFYEESQKVKNLTSENKQTVTLYAVWKGINYQVAFSSNGGEGSMDNQSFTYGIIDTLNSNTFTKEGYVFSKWNTKSDGTGTDYNNNQEINNLTNVDNQTIILYAQWKQTETASIITFDANGGEGTMLNQSFEHGIAQRLNKNTFTKENYAFKEWNTKSDGTGTSYSDGESITISNEEIKTITLYAIWKNNENITISFDSNGGVGSMESQLFEWNTPQQLMKNTFTKANYQFAGWNTKADGTGTSYLDESTFVINDSTITTITLYAIWKERDYTITEISLNKTEISLSVGETETLIATILPETATNKTVRWTSNNETIATVDQTGKVTALAKGKTIITARASNNFEAVCVVNVTESSIANSKIQYKTHVESSGWQDYVADGDLSGTTGKAKRLEAIRIKLDNQEYEGNILYRTHIQSYGWEKLFHKNDEMSGTSGQSLRLEAIEIKLDGVMAEHYDVYYRVHAQKFGWLGWAKNGESAGTSGYAYRLESIQIKLVEKGTTVDGYGTLKAFQKKKLLYRTHVQSYGWQQEVPDGIISGTVGAAKRLEAIQIILADQEYAGNILYRTHIESYGWESTFRKNGEMSGTSGLAKRLEAIEIKLDGEMAEHFDIYYRVHAQTYGWLNWAKNGEKSGTSGLGKRLEGIEIVVVDKGEKPPVRSNTNSQLAFVE